MTSEQMAQNMQSIEAQLNERANQLLANDPIARELLGIKKGLEMAQNGSVENVETIDEADSN